jgi:hypothetical protein
MALILGGLDENGRQVEHLVTPGRGCVEGESRWQGSVAVGAGVREEGNDMLAFVGRLEGAGGSLMAVLAALFATRGRRLGSRRGVGGGIGGRGSGGVLGVLVEASFELGEAGLELGDEGRQGSQIGLASAKEGDLGFEFGDAGLKGSAARTGGIGRGHTAAFAGEAGDSYPRERLRHRSSPPAGANA